MTPLLFRLALPSLAFAASLMLPACQHPPPSGASSPFTNSLGMVFLPVPGTDLQACRHETRVRDYRTFVRETGREWPETAFPQTADHPAVMVSWHDATAFCQWLSQKENRHYRLPTDEEWTLLLAQSATPHLRRYPWGTDSLPPSHGNYCDHQFGRKWGQDYAAAWLEDYDDGHASTAPVGACTPRDKHFWDLSGNVWEWCTTWIDPQRPRERVVRGGSWRTGNEERLRSTFRGPDPPDFRIDSVGFRILLVTP